MPDVTTTSPTTTSATSDTYSIRSAIVADADDDALRARPLDERAGRGVAIDRAAAPSPRAALGTTTRPTTPAGAMTAMSGRRPSRVPLSIVTVRKSGVGAGADDLGGRRLQVRAVAQLEQLLEPARAVGQRALLLQLRSAPSPSSRLQRVVLRLDAAAGRRSRSRRAGRRDAAGHAALHLGEDAEGDRLEHRHAALASSPAPKSGRRAPASRPGTGYPARWRISRQPWSTPTVRARARESDRQLSRSKSSAAD